MALPLLPSLKRMLLHLLVLSCAFALVVRSDDGPTPVVEVMTGSVPSDATPLTLYLSTAGVVNPLQYTLIPLIDNMGLNSTQPHNNSVRIDGKLVAANVSTYGDITDRNDIAYLCCDNPPKDGFTTPSMMLAQLMKVNPKAIILYSIVGNWCDINNDDGLLYTTILSMGDSGEAQKALSYLSASNEVLASITGNATSDDPSIPGRGRSTVAMSVLYSITGIISLLFLIIITTGAVRAHRYPERYGPRSAFGGRPRQSRAKGIARAVLDTIPIVKFGNQQPAKPDPELELDAATTVGRDGSTTGTVSNLPENQLHEPSASDADGSAVSPLPRDSQSITNTTETREGQLGCSICTEDFKVGEDVRVLPCSHQFHPTCIDPWLINVSGTCPLCRLDLHPGGAASNNEEASGSDSALPPPLALETDEGDAASATYRNRISRFFDVNRLRQATHEEQIEALRQMRVRRVEQDTIPESQDADGEERSRGARLTDKLKEKFRIRTRAQPPDRRDT